MSDPMQWKDVSENKKIPVQPHYFKESDSVSLAQWGKAGKSLAAIAMLSFGLGSGFAIFQWDIRWFLIGLVGFVTFILTASMFRKGV